MMRPEWGWGREGGSADGERFVLGGHLRLREDAADARGVLGASLEGGEPIRAESMAIEES